LKYWCHWWSSCF